MGKMTIFWYENDVLKLEIIIFLLQILRNVIMKIDAMSMKSLFNKLVFVDRRQWILISKIAFHKDRNSPHKIGNFLFFLYQQSQLHINH